MDTNNGPKILIAGFNKTGTKSLGDAFKQLGYRVFDASETYSIMHDHWCDVFAGKITLADIARIYEEHAVGFGFYNFHHKQLLLILVYEIKPVERCINRRTLQLLLARV